MDTVHQRAAFAKQFLMQRSILIERFIGYKTLMYGTIILFGAAVWSDDDAIYACVVVPATNIYDCFC